MNRYFQAFALFFRRINPVQTLSLGYLLMTLAGWILLCSPWFQALPTHAIDNLFTAASAVSTTGLTSVSVSDHYNFGGELLVFILIQMGGLGYMIFGSFIVLITRKKISKTHEELLRTDFGLPRSFDFRGFVQTVLLFTFFVEALGAAGLYVIFKEKGIRFLAAHYCHHGKKAGCECRKPKTGLFEKAIQGLAIEKSNTFFIGDKISDVQAGKNFGLKTAFVLTGHGKYEVSDLDPGNPPDLVCPSLRAAAEKIAT